MEEKQNSVKQPKEPLTSLVLAFELMEYGLVTSICLISIDLMS